MRARLPDLAPRDLVPQGMVPLDLVPLDLVPLDLVPLAARPPVCCSKASVVLDGAGTPGVPEPWAPIAP